MVDNVFLAQQNETLTCATKSRTQILHFPLNCFGLSCGTNGLCISRTQTSSESWTTCYSLSRSFGSLPCLLGPPNNPSTSVTPLVCARVNYGKIIPFSWWIPAWRQPVFCNWPVVAIIVIQYPALAAPCRISWFWNINPKSFNPKDIWPNVTRTRKE